jgi:hypothetical protein
LPRACFHLRLLPIAGRVVRRRGTCVGVCVLVCVCWCVCVRVCSCACGFHPCRRVPEVACCPPLHRTARHFLSATLCDYLFVGGVDLVGCSYMDGSRPLLGLCRNFLRITLVRCVDLHECSSARMLICTNAGALFFSWPLHLCVVSSRRVVSVQMSSRMLLLRSAAPLKDRCESSRGARRLRRRGRRRRTRLHSSGTGREKSRRL